MKFYRTDKFFDLRLKADLVSVSIYDTKVGEVVKMKCFYTFEDAINWAESQVNS